MPLDGRAAFQLGLLLLLVPAQYFITSYLPTDEAARSSAIRKLVSGAVGFKNQYLTWEPWRQWCLDIVQKVKGFSQATVEESDAPPGQSPAVEVLKFRDNNKYFASSPDPRSPRSPQVKYRVGQVIRHKRWGYRGIIVGWDEQARAPETWLKEMHPADKPLWRTQPNYSIIVDTRDRVEAQSTYVPEENIEIIANVRHLRRFPHYKVLVDSRDRHHVQSTYVVEDNLETVMNVRVMHPEVDRYFEAFDGAQYFMRPWLKALYPHD